MQQLAQGIASLGRGEDKMLVHMTPGEVSGLQSLALRHGGSLTINPHTGLPEAGFLSSILPMVGAGIGIALAPATGGASLYAMGGGALGGMLGSSMEGKSPLMGGLMGGISGYGMAGLGEAFAGMGTEALATGAASEGSAAANLAMQQAQGNTSMAVDEAIKKANLADFSGGDSYIGDEAYKKSLMENPAMDNRLQYNNVRPADFATNPYSQAGVGYQQAQGLTPEAIAQSARENAPAMLAPPPSPTDKMWEGAKAASNAPGDFLKKNWKSAAMAGAPLLMGLGAMGSKTTLPGKTPAQKYSTTYSPGDVNPRFGQPGQPYFLGQGYGPGSYSTSYAEGGDVARPYRGGDGEAPRYSREINSDAPGGGPASDDPGAGINKNTDSGLPLLFTKAGRATVEQYAKGSKNPALMAAALRELYSRNNAVDTVSAAEGGLMGGSKPDENKFYPGANIAGSSQNPTSTEVVGGYDPNLDPYTGEPVKMADGGLAGLLASQGNPEGRSQYSYTPVQQTFQKWTPPTPAAPAPAAPAAPTPAAAAPVDGGAGTYVYDPKTKQYTYTAPAAPVAATPDYGYDPSNLGSPGGDAGGAGGAGDMAAGGIASLGTYAAGGKLLQGPGDGMSDSIPAVIQGAKPQRAALAQGEFVIPADVVSHLGNGSTDAGSKRLYAMMDKVRHARTGNKKQGKQINADRFLPA